MKDERKTKAQLIAELEELRQRMAELESTKPDTLLVEESDATAKALLNAIADMAMLTDADGTIWQVNDAMARRFGKDAKELVGAFGGDLVSRDRAGASRTHFYQALETGESARFEYEREGAWFESVYYPVKNAQGQVFQVAVLVRDVTALKKDQAALKNANEKLEAIWSAVHDITFEIDREGRFFAYHVHNPELLYAPPEEFLGKTIRDVLPAEPADIIMHGLGRAAENGRQNGIVYFLETPVGSTWFELSIAAVGDPKAPDCHFVAVVYDVTARVRAEQELRKHRDQLAELVKERTTELEARNTELLQEVSRRARVEVALLDGTEQMRALHKLAQQISRNLPLEQAVPAALKGIVDTVRPDLAMLYLKQGEELLLQGAEARHADLKAVGPRVKRVGECLCGLAARRGRPYYSSDIHIDPRCTLDECKQAGLRSFAALPLLQGADVVGILGLASLEERDFSENATFLETLVNEVSVGVQNALLFEEAKRRASELEQQIAERSHVEAKLRASQHLLKMTFASLREAIFVVGMDPVEIIDCNPAAAEIFGYSREELLGETADVLHVDDDMRTAFRTRLNEAVEAQGFLHLPHFRMKRKDGSVFQSEHSVMPLTDNDGKRVGWVSVVRDISARISMENALREGEARYRSLFEQNLAGVVRTTLDGRFLECNPAFARLFGYASPEDVLARAVFEFYSDADDRSTFLDQLGQEGRLTNFVCRYRRSDGSSIWCLENAVLVDGEGDSPASILGTLIDITERTEALNDLRLFKSIVDASHEAIAVSDPDGQLIYINPAHELLFGRTLEEAQQLNYRDYYPEKSVEVLNQEVAPALARGETWEGELDAFDADGRCFALWERADAVRDASGAMLYGFGLMHDITEQKRALTELEMSERRFRSLVENAAEFIVVIGTDGLVQYVSQPVERILGYERNEMLGKAITDFVHPDDFLTNASMLADLVQEPDVAVPVDVRVKHKDGTWRHLAGAGTNLLDDPAVGGLAANLRDVTQEIQLEDEIRRRNEGLAALNAISAAAVSSLELGRVLRQILERSCYALGAATGSILLREPGTEEVFFLVSLSDELSNLYEHRLTLGEGIAGWVAQHGEPVLVNDVRQDPRWDPQVDATTGFETRSLLAAPLIHQGRISGIIEIINKLQGAFTEDDLSLLTATASITATALENARLFAFYQGRVRELTLLNEIGLSVTSILDRGELVQAAFGLLEHLFPTDGIFLFEPDDRTTDLCVTQARVPTGSIQALPSVSAGEGIIGWVMEHREAVLANDARLHPCYSSRLDSFVGERQVACMAAPLPVPEGAIGGLVVANWKRSPYNAEDLRTLQSVASVLSVALENARLYDEQKDLLVERVQMQQQLLHSEKMSALGRFAASMAHEINNPLQAIRGCLTLVGEEMEGPQREDRLARYLAVINAEIERIALLGQRMREFYRPLREHMHQIDVHDVLSAVLALTSRQCERGAVDVELDWMADALLVFANPDHLHQVFLNLVLNALDAMPQGGTLRIATARDVMRSGDLETTGTGPLTEALRVDVTDTGIGMSPEVQSRLFEPLFTTKESGSGLGLSTSYGIIEAHNGQFRVQSQEGVGTTFSVLLPVAQEPATDV